MKQLLFTIYLFVSSLAFSQLQDVGVWTGLKVSQKIDKKARIAFSQGFRFDDNVSNLANMYSQIKGGYNITDFLKLSMAYRWAQKKAWRDDLKIENRYQFDLRYKYKKKDLAIKNRVRFQSKYANYRTSEYGYISKTVIRNETVIEYRVTKKITPYASVELFQPVNSDFNTINKLRYQVGSSFDITKNISGELFFLLQKEVNRTTPLTSYITGISLSYDLPKVKLMKSDK